MSRTALATLLLLAAAVLPAQEPADKPARDLKPRPAELAPLAARSLLLAVTRAGEQLVAVGDRGNILLSSDGAAWHQVASPVHAALTAVAFADAQHGWAAGHDATLLRTADGGRTWSLQNFRPTDSKPLLGLLPLDAQRAYAVGAYGLFLATTDGGSTWTEVDAPAVRDDGLHLNALVRLNDGSLFIAGETGLLAVSADGQQWQRLTLPYEGSLFGALPHGDKGALVFGLRGNVLVSDDVRSNRWTRVATGTVQSMFGGTRLANGEAALVGADGKILLVDATGRVRSARGPGDEAGLGSGTLSGVVPWKDQLLVVGELGVSSVRVPPP